MSPTKLKQPQQGEPQRRTTLSLTPQIWEQLVAIETETGAKPSVTVRKMLNEALRRRRGDADPAA